ncbi:transglycosylase SLT domain-containing protein [Acetobacter musti]|uniref:Transglycosylase SLT domain-containing protein n=1 Tax=Acetobacter musti TaxID=864732 RepID=A0ABX0JU73_9PROT|nr:lytic transglycosylase domain-containing protein [Acetobacter musti]NHN85520.1 transglycosylase SLT domain-containing protein [Acetobacter musti]
MNRHRFHLLAAAVLSLSACAAAPQTASPPSSYGAAAWPTEQQAVNSGPVDDVAGRLTIWLQIIGKTDATISAKTYADFLATRPVWPRWHLIENRYQQALASEPDDTIAATLCREHQPTNNARALSRCARVAGVTTELQAAVRAAWREGADNADDAAILQSLAGSNITPEDSWIRFEREERTGQLTAATRTTGSFSPDQTHLAAARLAFRRNDADAETLLNALSASFAHDPILVLDHARWMRKAQRVDDALALWKNQGFTAERDDPAAGAAFWTERDALARALLAGGRPQEAFTIARDMEQGNATHMQDAAFLAGWIALRQLHDPHQAESLFRRLVDSPSLLTRSSGWYWLGRTHMQTGNTASATADWQRAAEFPQTFYGQMATAALSHAGVTLLAPTQPPAALMEALQQWWRSSQQTGADTTATEVHVDGSNLAQAAQILVSWNDRTHARDFLTLLVIQDTDPADQRALGKLAQRLGLPDVGVTVARRASLKGNSMPDLGWPEPFAEPKSDLPSGLPLGLMRQESNFNPDAVSVSGAVGLMQLLLGTARDMARTARIENVTVTALHTPAVNIQLGTAYLDQVYRRFGGVVPYTAAAYNAGPHRVSQWLQSGGDPAPTNMDQDALIDWIEQIPYSETRRYVKRVWESMAVYGALKDVQKRG